MLAASGRRPNCLFVCNTAVTSSVLQAALVHAVAPITECVLPGSLSLPDQTGGTLVLADAAALRLDQQIALFDWLARGRKVQVMTFSSVDPATMIQDGRFLEGLYYRLNVVRIDVAVAN